MLSTIRRFLSKPLPSGKFKPFTMPGASIAFQSSARRSSNGFARSAISEASPGNDDCIYPEPGECVGGFRVVDIAGAPGGTAIVLFCEDDSDSGRKVAVKRFFKSACGSTMKRRISEEAALKLRSNCVVGAEAFFEEDGFMHSVMPFVEGKSLRDVLGECEAIPEDEAVFIAICATMAVAKLHSQGILATDVKPDNVILGDDGFAKLIDLVCFERPGRKAEISLGTAPYAAPELMNRGCLYEATDFYSIGVMLIELLVGAEEFMGISGTWERDLKRGTGLNLRFLRSRFPSASGIIERAVNLDPMRRHESADALLSDLKSCYRRISNSRICSVFTREDGAVLPVGRSVIGRDALFPGCPYISESQFEADFSNGELRLRDIAGKNKACVNRELIGSRWVPLSDGDMIRIANVKIEVEIR